MDPSPASRPRPLRPTAPDVLIVGAGPTGLTLACELLRRGIACRVIDEALAPTDQSRALAVHSRTLEAFNGMGIAEELLGVGRKLFGMNVYADNKRIVHATLEDLDTPYPFILSVPQATTERVLRDRVRDLGGRIERGLAFRSLSLHDEGVVATLQSPQAEQPLESRRAEQPLESRRAEHPLESRRAEHPSENAGREEVVQTPWLVGCDGAHSAVRKSLALPFEGARYEEVFVLGDVELASDLAFDEAHTFLSPEGALAVLPLPGERRARLVADNPPEAIARGDEPVTIDVLRAIVAARGMQRVAIDSAGWLAAFRIHRRIVPSYRVGRVFLAGDAAHIHSPVGGQGMNTGIQDVCNLAWKLALAIKGVARPVLLDSYELERRPIAAATLEGTDLATRIVTLRHPVSRELRNQLARLLSSFEFVRHRIAGTTAELRVGYADSPIVGEHRAPLLRANVFADRTTEKPSVRDWLDFGAAPEPGERAPDVGLSQATAEGCVGLFNLLDTTRHTLFLFDGGAPTLDGYRNLSTIAAQVAARFGDLIAIYVIVPRSKRPPELTGDLDVVLDDDGALHHRYGAGSECLYLIRPDGYVAFRSQPAELGPLEEFLGRLFVVAP